MKKLESHDGNVDHDDIIDLGVASEETKGIPYPQTVEAFQSRQPLDELSAD